MTKRSTANANTEKNIPPAMSQRNQHLTHAMLRKPATTTPKQFQTTWCFGKDWQHAGGARDLQSATVFPGILPFRYTCKKYCFLLKLRNFSQKRSLQQSHFWARKHIGFLDSKKWFSPVATIAYGTQGLRTGETTWGWPDFHSDPTQENLGQITRWSLNQAPDWTYPLLAIANQ